MVTAEKPGERNLMLDAIRGIAALAVVCYHLEGLAPVVPFPHGYAAVDVFFVLSGFVLAKAKGKAIEAGAVRTGGLMAWRLMRLLPTIWIGSLIGAAVMPMQAHHPSMALMLAMGMVMIPMLSASAPGYNVFPLAPAAWSLFSELAVNAGWPVLARRDDKAAVLIMTMGVGAVLVVHGCLVFGHVDFGATPGGFAIGLGRAIYGFPVGVALHAVRHRLPTLPPWVGYALLALDLAVPAPAIMGAWWDIAMTLIVAPCIVASSVHACPGRLTAALARAGAALSYPLYATHGQIVSALGSALNHVAATAAGREAGVVVIVLCCLGTAWCAALVEKVIRRTGRRLAKGKTGEGRRPALSVLFASRRILPARRTMGPEAVAPFVGRGADA